jgi:hypothetical protein
LYPSMGWAFTTSVATLAAQISRDSAVLPVFASGL